MKPVNILFLIMKKKSLTGEEAEAIINKITKKKQEIISNIDCFELSE